MQIFYTMFNFVVSEFNLSFKSLAFSFSNCFHFLFHVCDGSMFLIDIIRICAEFKDTTSEATGSLIFQLSEALGVSVSPETATALFAAIATDTGWFRFAAVSAETMRITGRLIECGASPPNIYRELYEQGTLAKMHLVGRALSRMQLDCDGELAYTTVDYNEFVQVGAVPADTEDLVNECLKVAGTKGAFIAIEQQNRQVKISFRSRLEALNVAGVAEQFSGGGHRLAAGATLNGPFRTAVSKALEAMKAAIVAARPQP